MQERMRTRSLHCPVALSVLRYLFVGRATPLVDGRDNIHQTLTEWTITCVYHTEIVLPKKKIDLEQ